MSDSRIIAARPRRARFAGLLVAAVILVTPLSALVSRPGPGLGADPRADTLPRYDRAVLLDSRPDTSANASVGDLDGDGHLDIVLAKGRHWPAVDRVLLGDGRGGFRRDYPLGSISDRSYTAALADLDRDGDLDLVVSNDRPDPNPVYLNDGHGVFRHAGNVGDSTWSTRNAAVADVDGDGLPDIVFANRSGSRPGGNFLCRNLGAGRFAAPCLLVGTHSATTIAVADLDGDGRSDLVIPHRDGGQSLVLLQDPATGFTGARAVPFGPPDASIRIAAAADFDADGRIDLVTVDERVGIRLYPGTGSARFGAPVPIGDDRDTPYALTVADLNRDGRPDVIVGFVEAPSAVFFNGGAAGFTRVSSGDQMGTVYGFAVGDLNEDGLPDIVAARSEAPSVLYLGRR